MTATIKKKDLLYGILLFIQLKPESIVYLSPIIDFVWDILRYISFIIVFSISFYKHKKLIKSKGFLSILCFIFIFYGSICIGALTTNNSNLLACLYECVRTLAVFLIIYLVSLNCVEKEIDFLILVYSFFVLINFFTVIFYPNGMYVNQWGIQKNYFLGAKNIFLLYTFPYVTLIGYKIITGTTKFSYLIMLFLSLLSSVIVWSGSNMFIIALLICGIALTALFTKFCKIFNLKNYLIVTLFLCLTIVIYHNLSIFSWLIEGVLKKDITLTGRVGIWESTIEAIKLKPLFGYGILDGNTIIEITNNKFGINTHNMYLWCLFRGGIVNLACLIGIFLRLNFEIAKYKNNKVIVFLSWSIFLLFISWMSEAHSIIFMMPIIILPFRTSELLSKNNIIKAKE